MLRNLGHLGFVLVSAGLIFCVKSLNPPQLDYDFVLSTTVDCIEDNLSGITYNAQSGTFFVVSNYPPSLIEISTTGECLNHYALENFDDTEDVYYLDDGHFLLVEERKQTLNLIHLISDEVKVLQSIVFNLDVEANRGLEGVAYCHNTNAIYLVNEKPQKILRIKDWRLNHPVNGIETVDSFWAQAMLNDYSAITTNGDELLVLSDESKRLLKLNYSGRILAELDLEEAEDSALGNRALQAEGVALDHDQNIYIVSEPNRLYVYKKKPADVAGFLAFAD